MIVLTIIGILATMAQPSLQKTIVRAKETSLRRTLFVMRDVIDQYYADHGGYPDRLEALVEEKYIRAVPEDPFTNSSSSWVLIPPETEKGAIFDVQSGSDLIGLNSIPYYQW
jgi:general secretion pathway protein G